MDTPEYEYSGMIASTWDLWRDNTDSWDDRFFYLDIVREYGQPVLDVGCGTGRIVLDSYANGIDIDGVDNSPEMLAICKNKAQGKGLHPNLYQQDIRFLELPCRYRTILVPSSKLQLIVDEEDVRKALQLLSDQLLPGGALVAPFSFDWREGDPLDTGWTLLFEKVRPEDGATVRSWTREVAEPEKQLWHSSQRFEIELDGKVIGTEEHHSSPGGRWYTQAQAVELFREVGFDNIQLFHEFTKDPAGPDDRLFCVLGGKLLG